MMCFLRRRQSQVSPYNTIWPFEKFFLHNDFIEIWWTSKQKKPKRNIFDAFIFFIFHFFFFWNIEDEYENEGKLSGNGIIT